MKNLINLVVLLLTLASLSACGGNSSGVSTQVDPGGQGTVCENPKVGWIAPTQNSDGTPLVNLAGFRVYRGLSPRDYSEVVEIVNPNTLMYQFAGLQTGINQYFSATAFNTLDIASVYSAEVGAFINNCTLNKAKTEPKIKSSRVDEIGNILVLIPFESRYELLMKAYNDAKERPIYNDFQEIGDPAARNCVEVTEKSEGDLQVIKMHRFKKVLDGGGPLLPPEVIEKVIVAESPNLLAHFEITSNEFTRRDLITNLKYDESNGRETRIRKSGETLHFYSKVLVGNSFLRSYGYCY